MANAKTTTLSIRIEPGLKEVLSAAVEQEHRSIASMVEVMIRTIAGATESRSQRLTPTNVGVKAPRATNEILKSKQQTMSGRNPVPARLQSAPRPVIDGM
jgi:hypothetical protein